VNVKQKYEGSDPSYRFAPTLSRIVVFDIPEVSNLLTRGKGSGHLAEGKAIIRLETCRNQVSHI
jgi:hypothetical protein